MIPHWKRWQVPAMVLLLAILFTASHGGITAKTTFPQHTPGRELSSGAPHASKPTHTPKPTKTPKPTHTPKPTRTPKPTKTPRRSATPTATPTATESPSPTTTTLPTETPPPSTAPNTFQLIDDALTNGEITRDEAATYKVYSLFGVGDPYLPAQFISSEPVPGDGTLLFLDALKDWEQQSPETQEQIHTFITPKEITGTLPLTLTTGITAPQRGTSPTPKLGPGMYHLRGTLIAQRQARWQVTTTRGAFRVRINAQTILQAQGQRISADELKPGEQFDGIFQVTRKGRMIARKLRIIHASSETVSPRVQTSNQVLTTSTAPWVNLTNLASGQSGTSAPALAVDAEGNTHAVWYAHTAPMGLYWSYKPRTGDWSAAQHVEGTDETAWAPALAVDALKNLYLAWENSTAQGLEIRFVQKNWNAAAQLYDAWTAPSVISAAGADGTDAEMGVTNANNDMQLHASWREMFCPVAEPCILRATYREWRRGLGWQPLVILSATTQVVDYAALAVSRLGRAAVAFVDDTCAGGHCAPLYYRQCDAAQTAGDCSDVAQWSAAETVSPGTALAPDLSFDTSGVAHLAWYGFANGKSIFYSARPANAAQWSAPLVLATVTNSNTLELYPRIAAGTPNNVYLFWNDGVANLSAPTMYYRQWDGHAWADMRPLNTDVAAYSAHWAAVAVDGNNVTHVAWRGKTDGVWYAEAAQVAINQGLVLVPGDPPGLQPICRLTEFYDTPTAPFRIYFTRTYPNMTGNIVEKDCRVFDSTTLTADGYPAVIQYLSDALELSYDIYGANEIEGLGYAVEQTYREPRSGRYPIFITSDPAWTCPDGFPSYLVWCFQGGGGLTSPQSILIPRNSTAPRLNPNDPNSAPRYRADKVVDWFRAMVAHEFFHAVQYAYYPPSCYLGPIVTCAGDDRLWWMEATAVWASRKVYPACGWCAVPEGLLRQPYKSLTTVDDLHQYGSFIFATFLEEQVAHSPAIIRETWTQYLGNGGGSMLEAIKQAIQGYGTTLDTEFPRFTWHNYFLNGDAYNDPVVVYMFETNLEDGADNPKQFEEWKMLRARLREQRNNWEAGNAAASVDRVGLYPRNGPIDYSSLIQTLGAGYIEFRPNGVQGTLRVEFDIGEPAPYADTIASISVLPIRNFAQGPHPNNQFLAPSPIGLGSARYSFRVYNFEGCDRVTLIANGKQGFTYSHHAEILPPDEAIDVPCALVAE